MHPIPTVNILQTATFTRAFGFAVDEQRANRAVFSFYSPVAKLGVHS